MIYAKKEINGTVTDVEIEVDNMYCRCAECGKELNLQDDIMIDDIEKGSDVLNLFDAGTSVYCSECTKKRGVNNAG